MDSSFLNTGWGNHVGRWRIPVSTHSKKPVIAKSRSLMLHAKIHSRRYWDLVITTNEDKVSPFEIKQLLQEYLNHVNGRLINFKVELENE